MGDSPPAERFPFELVGQPFKLSDILSFSETITKKLGTGDWRLEPLYQGENTAQ